MVYGHSSHIAARRIAGIRRCSLECWPAELFTIAWQLSCRTSRGRTAAAPPPLQNSSQPSRLARQYSCVCSFHLSLRHTSLGSTLQLLQIECLPRETERTTNEWKEVGCVMYTPASLMNLLYICQRNLLLLYELREAEHPLVPTA